MNANIIFLSDNILMGKKNCPSLPEQMLVEKGFYVSSKSILPSFYPELKQLLQKYEKELSIIIVEKDKGRVNESLAELCNDVIKDNYHLKKAVSEYYRMKNEPMEKTSFAEWQIPSKARGIVCETSINQGYILKSEQGNFVVLSLQNYADMLELAINEIENNNYKTITFKTFGLLEENVKSLIKEYSKNRDGIKFLTIYDDLDVDIILKAKEDNEKLEEYSRKILSSLSKFIYAEEDLPIFKVLYSLLSITKKKISIAESITGGNLVGSIIKYNEGASQVIDRAFVTYSNQAKIDILGVNPETISLHTAVSVETAYEMATGLLKRTNADIVIATTGYASDFENNTAGECYIAVGDKEAIHVYKNIFSGTREKIIDNVVKASCFYAIKKLRSKDFNLN